MSRTALNSVTTEVSAASIGQDQAVLLAHDLEILQQDLGQSGVHMHAKGDSTLEFLQSELWHAATFPVSRTPECSVRHQKRSTRSPYRPPQYIPSPWVFLNVHLMRLMLCAG